MAGTPDNPLRVAVVGSGPAGFYATGHLLAAKDVTASVDLYDRLPTPFGLVRAGVAPDHPKIKSVTRVYEKTAAREGFRFFGNVEVGRDISHDELKQHYHAVIYAYGCERDRHMGIPGEDLPGSWAATEFVAWYNGHPDYQDLEFDLSAKRAVVIGNGNVAMDVARMLVLPRAELDSTDTTDAAIEAIAGSGVEEVVILGRRGPAQAAFTNPELRELGELTDADVIVDPAEVELDDRQQRSRSRTRARSPTRRNVEILADYAQPHARGQAQARGAALPALAGGHPRRRQGGVDRAGAQRARARRRRRACGPRPPASTRRWRPAWCSARSATGALPIEGVPFDEWHGTIPNEEGRIVDPESEGVIPGEYVAGWIKRGPSGVIGTNKRDAQETVEHVLEDLAEGRLPDPPDPDPGAWRR